MTMPDEKDPQLQVIERMAKSLSPEDRARAFLEFRIETLVEEAIATSAIEGITIDPKAARKAVLSRLAREAGLL